MNIKTTIMLNNGVEIPVLGIGTWQLKYGKECESAVSDALDFGYRHIDTAAIYGNEESVGAAIKKSNIPRKDLFITTKIWNSDHKDPYKAFNLSLNRLGLDYVDLYLIHWPVQQRNESWKALEALYHEKKCRAIGVSNFTMNHLQELLKTANIVPAVNQIELHPWLYQKELIEFCNKNLIAVEAYSPLTRGMMLTNPILIEIAKKYGKSPAQVLIRWCLQHNLVTLPKSSHRARILENMDVFDFEIVEEDMATLDALGSHTRFAWDPTNIG